MKTPTIIRLLSYVAAGPIIGAGSATIITDAHQPILGIAVLLIGGLAVYVAGRWVQDRMEGLGR